MLFWNRSNVVSELPKSLSGFGNAPAQTYGRSLLGSVLQLTWIVVLILPAATTMSAWHDWDVDQHYLLAASCWLVLALRILIPGGLFFVVTYPIAVMGIACMVADFLRNVDLLELALQWRTFSAMEISSALRPYLMLGVVIAGAGVWICWKCYQLCPKSAIGRPKMIAFMIASAVLIAVAPAAVWIRAWPADAILVAASIVVDSSAMSMYLFPGSSTTNPRDPKARWNALQAAPPDDAQTLVLVIGESVRSDFLRECGGPPNVRPVVQDALVSCDVTAGSDATHTSVPLLVSREMPGHRVRVSNDATFLHAYQETGFETHWYSVQGNTMAWADAQYQSYPPLTSSDAAALLSPLLAAIARPRPRKVVVLHAYNAHEPYCGRYDAAAAPYRVSCDGLGSVPSVQTIDRYRLTYANAVDSSIGFLNEVIEHLSKIPGQVFLIYTPDHGENLLDDRRQLYGHAMRHPTRWDIRVPAVFWANEAWHHAHANQWAMLKSQAGAPLMHADLIPTLLGAASIQYEEPRQAAVNLLAVQVPHRSRIVQRSVGAVTDWETLEREAK